MKYNIISIPRSGSGYIRSLISKNLEFNDKFYSISEPFNWSKNRKISPSEIIERMQTSDVVVTKNHISELVSLYTTHSDLYSSFFAIPFAHILLLRKNIFQCTLSRCVAHVTDQWSEYTYTSDDKISIPINLDMSELTHSLSMWECIATNYFNVSYYKIVYYEDLSFSSNDLDIFEIKSIIPVDYQKSPEKHKLVLNYDELKQATFDVINTIHLPHVLVDGLNLSLDLQK